MYKLKKTPKGGRRLWSYMAAILEVTGMDDGQVFNLKRFFSNFSTHIENGRIEIVPGGYRLTEVGINYFADRYNEGSRQRIYRTDVEAMIRGIETGVGEDEWVNIE